MAKIFVGTTRMCTTTTNGPNMDEIQTHKIWSLTTGKLIDECEVDHTPDHLLKRELPAPDDIRVELVLKGGVAAKGGAGGDGQGGGSSGGKGWGDRERVSGARDTEHAHERAHFRPPDGEADGYGRGVRGGDAEWGTARGGKGGKGGAQGSGGGKGGGGRGKGGSGSWRR